MYAIGPLLFWACAEMTCGFFILSVPCLPKLIGESGLSRRIKEYLGISVGSKNVDSSYGPRSGSHQLSKSKRNSDSYNRIGESGIHMSNIERSESQEHLNDVYVQGKNGVQVTRTTHITVSSDSHSVSDLDNPTLWTK